MKGKARIRMGRGFELRGEVGGDRRRRNGRGNGVAEVARVIRTQGR